MPRILSMGQSLATISATECSTQSSRNDLVTEASFMNVKVCICCSSKNENALLCRQNAVIIEISHLERMAAYQAAILKQLRNERQLAKERCAEYERRLKAKLAELADAEERMRQAGDVNSETKALKSVADSIAELTTESRLTHDRCQQLEQQYKKLQQEMQDVTDRLKPLQQRVNELEANRHELKKGQDCVEYERKSLLPMRKDIVTNKVEQQRLLDLLQEKQHRISELEERLRNNSSAQSSLIAEQLKAARANIVQLQQRASQLQQKLEDAKDAKTRVETEQRNAGDDALEIKATREHLNTLELGLKEKERQLAWCQEELRRKREYVCEKARVLGECFVVNKQELIDRHKWGLCIWSQLKPVHRLVRTWFEFENDKETHAVFLLGSFYNWEVGVLLTHHDDGHFGLWLDLPPGRHEFRFLVDGEWRTSSFYPTTCNDFSTDNNIRVVVSDDDVSTHHIDESACRHPPPLSIVKTQMSSINSSSLNTAKPDSN